MFRLTLLHHNVRPTLAAIGTTQSFPFTLGEGIGEKLNRRRRWAQISAVIHDFRCEASWYYCTTVAPADEVQREHIISPLSSLSECERIDIVAMERKENTRKDGEWRGNQEARGGKEGKCLERNSEGTERC
ncbi:hypothetical protein M8J76_006059 [Diaphorina citri]|nr:hypothetical protein M8J75_004710 [Diaphorina citri]KAI5736680.1 hypothetical protein M8J76_006059 [Diaphorina citri]KAI5743875.1 hypothetical protein M8J77_023182 [Diaphorina citri]